MIDISKIKFIREQDYIELQLTDDTNQPWHLLQINKEGKLTLYRGLSGGLFIVNHSGALDATRPYERDAKK